MNYNSLIKILFRKTELSKNKKKIIQLQSLEQIILRMRMQYIIKRLEIVNIIRIYYIELKSRYDL